MTKLSLGLLALLLVLPVSLYAHEEHKGKHHDGHHDGDHDHAALCDRFILKAGANIPDLAKPNWKEITTIVGGFTYVFYHDLTQPNLAVAAMTVAGKNSDSNLTLTRLTWQAANEMRSVRLELDEMVCVKSVIGKDGNAYNLEGLLKRLTEKQK